MSIIVNVNDKTVRFGDSDALEIHPCRIGRDGFIAQALGREGDGKTPLGAYTVRFGFYRPDRLPGLPPGGLTIHALQKDDGWCDDPRDPAYNRFIKLPYPASHERLWREDGAYDIALVISHNDDPPEPGKGSAVFIHIAQPDDRATLGCVAVTPDVMMKMLRLIKTGSEITILDHC